MNRIRNLIKKINRQALIGGVCLALGICFIALSGVFLTATVRIAGGILALVAVVRLILTIRRYRVIAITAEVLNSALLFLVGLIVALNPGGTLNLIYASNGAYLAINSGAQIYRIFTSEKRRRCLSWWTRLLCSCAIFLLGLWLMFAPATVQRVTEIVAGVALLAKSAELFGKAYHEREERKKQKSNDIEADFVDKSHEL